jgi:hypothetical protein
VTLFEPELQQFDEAIGHQSESLIQRDASPVEQRYPIEVIDVAENLPAAALQFVTEQMRTYAREVSLGRGGKLQFDPQPWRPAESLPMAAASPSSASPVTPTFSASETTTRNSRSLSQ